MAEEHMVAVLASGAVIVISHPGQETPSDPLVLRRNFGVTPGMVVPLSATAHAIPSGADAPPTADQVAQARAVLDRHAVHMAGQIGGPPQELTSAPPVDIDALVAEITARVTAQLREEPMIMASDSESPDTTAKRGARNTAKPAPDTASGPTVTPGTATPAPGSGAPAPASGS
ncbi:MAG: hypothetical protein QOK39_105 [Acidimicrobiaceae bacterium]|jgi:hypothetical protein|nr:hypothetical protein [Acidimicrobiaceae bacterium]